MSPVGLLELLKRYFGFDSFRPLQEEIIRTALEGRDAFVLMPTGGGKSLCYQLPALAREGLTVVVSPLIALMKDQVDALQAAGVPATFLNSTLDAAEARRRLAGLYNGEFRLLYVAPERLMLDGMLDRLEQWQTEAIAIDEAHCISEWGHDFRPEYRQIAELRFRFPDLPFMAFTATATDRVRADIVTQLKLRDPAKFVASFDRANLVYRVLPRAQPQRQVLEWVNKQPEDSGIIYCSSRARTERLADMLNENGVRAAAYHAGLDKKVRARNQEAFIRDEVRVVCATIAFGMGIDKPDVRFVIHHDLPKNLEGYYQETGRAGRDGLPAECVLLFNASDVAKQTGFIMEKTDEHEQIATAIIHGAVRQIGSDAPALRIVPGGNRRARGRTDGGVHIKLFKAKAFGSHPVDVGCLGILVAKTGKVAPPHVINKDEHNIRLRHSEGGVKKRGYKKCEQLSHVKNLTDSSHRLHLFFPNGQ